MKLSVILEQLLNTGIGRFLGAHESDELHVLVEKVDVAFDMSVEVGFVVFINCKLNGFSTLFS